LKNVGYFNAAFFNQRLHRERHGQVILQQRGGNQRANGANADIVDAGRILRRVGTAGLLVVIRVVEAAHGGGSPKNVVTAGDYRIWAGVFGRVLVWGQVRSLSPFANSREQATNLDALQKPAYNHPIGWK
jgi:hypothetical protein